MLLENYQIRRIIAGGILAILAIFALTWLYHYFFFGKISVKTSVKTNIVKITRISADKSETFSEQHQGGTSLRVKPGTYSVSVYRASSTYGITRTVKVKARQNVKLTLDPPAMINVEPVAGRAVSSVYATNDQLFYLDSISGLIVHVDSGGKTTNPIPNVRFKSVQWISPKLAVGQSTDNNAYLIQNNVASLLPPNNDPAASYTLSAAGKLYASTLGNVYGSTPGSPHALYAGGNFKKIYSPGTPTRLIPGGDNLAVIETGKGGEGTNSLAVVDASGKVTEKNIDTSLVAWSPNGKYLAVSINGNYAVMTPKLSQTKLFAAQQSAAVVWSDDDTILYSIANQLWKYSISQGQSEQMTALGAGNNITGIFLSSDKKYAYLATSAVDSDGDGQLLRVGLNGQTFDKSLKALSAFLPEDVGVCSFNYVNFIKPIITVSYPEFQTDGSLCVASAKGQLRDYGLNPDSFSYSVSATTDNSQ
jgi:hypothetical protein